MVRSQMLEQMSGSEFYDWMALESIDPFTEVRADIRTGILASVVANSVEAHFASMFRNYRVREHSVQEFMPKFGETTSAKDKARLEAMTWAASSAVSQELERRRLAKANA